MDNQASEIRIDGDLAVARGTYTLTVAPAVGEATSESGWWTGVWRRQADRGWKGEWNAWGTERPTAAPAS